MKKGIIIAVMVLFVCAIGFKAFVNQKNVELFEKYVYSPMPSGFKIIDVKSMFFQGGYLYVDFLADSDSFYKIIKDAIPLEGCLSSRGMPIISGEKRVIDLRNDLRKEFKDISQEKSICFEKNDHSEYAYYVWDPDSNKGYYRLVVK